jgi:K+-transporting ATPase ATPase A chain
MTSQAIILLVCFLTILLLLAYPIGIYMVMVAEGKRIPGLGWVAKLEEMFYRIAGTSSQSSMSWKSYAVALFVFNTIGGLFVYGIQRMQAWLTACCAISRR